MFRHSCLTLVLAASLLACPLRCLGSFGSAVGSPETVVGCACCHQDNATECPEHRIPQDDCSCPNCLCDGALLIASEAAVDLSPAAGSYATCAAVNDRFTPEARTKISQGWSEPGPPESGRLICYRHCSLLI